VDKTVSDTLTFHLHISALVAKSARSFYALKTIRAHGLNGNALWDVTRATLVSQLLYASPAWWGYLKADERNRLQAVIKKAIWYGYLPRSFSRDPSALWTNQERTLTENCFSYPGTTPTMFFTASSPNLKHWLYLRQCTHDLTLPTDISAIMKQNFVYRMLFRDIY